MTKAELIDKVAEKAKVTKADAAKVIAGLLENITKAMTKGDDVTLVGFGTFTVSKRAARTGRNPQTGASIKIAAAKVPKFKAGKALKDAINKR
ncbi:MAG: HU family DNA-binding protein [Deltaproteobacteria bacterium]|nr:HU family DNA-binding protein [Deltaproteobacteria bacterium]